DGSRIPVDEPDLTKPVRIFLTPAPDRAGQTVDITEIIGEPLDLGFFEIKVLTAEDMFSYSVDEDAYQAPPSARE
ncbi:MAG: hypothetical protein L3J65_06165, partial [Robiginitomaculum sp.]|nr:hypothetical protein [Robiginitomaculum sp.]